LNIAELEKMLDVTPTNRSDQGLKSLDFEDEEVENLLSELEGSMLIDRKSVWQLAGRDIPKNSDENDEAFHLNFADIDFEMLKSHPKIQQYTSPSSGHHGSFYDLPVPRVLASILEAFELSKMKRSDQVDGSSKALTGQDGSIVKVIPPEDPGEGPEGGRHSSSTRIKRVLKRFIKRFIQGLSSQDYIEFAGPKIFTRNYVIFLRLLWLLFTKDYLDDVFIVKSLIKIWKNYYGSSSKKGVFEALNSEEKAQVKSILAEFHSDSLMISALYYCAYLSRSNGWHDIQRSLRDFWNDFLVELPIRLDEQLLEISRNFLTELEIQSTVNLSQMTQELLWLSRYGSDEELLNEIEQRFDLPKNCCSFRVERVNRPSINQKINSNSLIINCDHALDSIDKAVDILQTWRKYDDQEYYRITTEDKSRLLWYDTLSERGVFYIKEPREIVDINSLPSPSPPKWLSQMEKLKKLSKAVEEAHVLK
jgi:hypothetical protein